MKPIFFYGSLRDKELIEVVLDRPVADTDLLQADAVGFATETLPHESYPVLVESPACVAQGVLLCNATDADIARLEYFEEAEYHLVDIEVTHAGHPIAARYFQGTERAPATGRLWNYATWQQRDRAVALHAARALMACHGVVPVEHIDEVWPGIMNRAYQSARGEAEEPVTGGIRSAISPDDVEPIALERPFTAFAAVERHRLRHKRFDGGWVGPVDRLVTRWSDAAAVLPYDPRLDRVMLVEQFRPGPMARGDRAPWCIEAIAGMVDTDEDPEATARREAVEEGGIALTDLDPIPPFYPSPGMAAEKVYAFIGRADLAGNGGLHGLAGEAEDIRSIILPVADALAALEAGEINTGTASLCLLWLGHRRAALRAIWG